MVLASGWQVNLPRRSSIPFQKFSHGFPLYFPQLYCISCTISHPFLRCTLPVPVRLFPSYPSHFLHDSRLSLAFLRIPLSKNAKRAQAAACAQNKRLLPFPGRSVLDERASAGSAPLDHRPVGRPMIRRQRNPPRSVGPPAGDTSQGKEEPTHRKFRHDWAEWPPFPGLDSPRQVGYTTPQKTFAWTFFRMRPTLTLFATQPFRLCGVFCLPGRRAIFPLGGSLL